jgi:hypothetical protein
MVAYSKYLEEKVAAGPEGITLRVLARCFVNYNLKIFQAHLAARTLRFAQVLPLLDP